MPLVNYSKAQGVALCELHAPPANTYSYFSEGLALERELQQQLFLSNDAREGISAHVEKREPRFQGN
jgi:enoyl-CoA hydratase/carnithine racemase